MAYIEASSQDDFDWGLRSAEILRDVLLMLARRSLTSTLASKRFGTYAMSPMARSLEWILEREGPAAKAVVGAHNTHLQQCGVRAQRPPPWGLISPTGLVGRKSCSSVRQAPIRSRAKNPSLTAVPPPTNRSVLIVFFLDLRQAPQSGPVADWLNSEHLDRHNLRYGPITPGPAWDCLLFSRRVRIADVALAPSMEMARAAPNPAQFDNLIGRFIVIGFLAAKNTLDIIREGECLFANGEEDTSGELFPPYRSENLRS